jgi:hypothetical protein
MDFDITMDNRVLSSCLNICLPVVELTQHAYNCTVTYTSSRIYEKVKALHKVVYICLRKEIKFGSFDRIYLYQMVLRYVLKQSELKYVKELSFHSVFSFHFRYLEHLNMRKDIHTYWLSQLTERICVNYTHDNGKKWISI